jgi:hypothetical protein
MDWKAAINFTGKDDISAAIKRAQGTTDTSSKKMGESMKRAAMSADDLKGKIGSIGNIAGGVAIGNLISAGIRQGVVALKNLIKSVDEFAGRAAAAGREGAKIGLSAESFQKLAYAASLSSVPTEKLTGAFGILNKNLGQFQLASGTLYKHLNDNNKILLAQIKTAKSNEEVFGMLADVLANETDVAKRAALGNAALGKSWAELYPLLAQGADGIKAAADSIPDLISDRQVAMATVWNDSWSAIKRNIQGFCDIIRSAVIQYVGPYVLALKEWIATNREMIKDKIHEVVQKAVVVFKKAVFIVQDLIKKMKDLIKFFKDWGPIILAIGGTIGVFMGIVSAVLAIKNAVMATKAAFAILNAVMLANPVILIITAIVAAVALLIAGFTLLVRKVGGFKEALMVVAQTIMKFLLAPFNLVLDAVQGLMWGLGHVPGMNWARDTSAGIQSFQDKINMTLTGGTGTFLESGVRGAIEGYESGGVAGAIKGTAGGVAGVVTESYDRHRAAYLEAHPEEAPGVSGNNEEEKWESMLDKFDEMIAAQKGTTGAVLDLDLTVPTDNSPARLRWDAMGTEDFFSTARAGL